MRTNEFTNMCRGITKTQVFAGAYVIVGLVVFGLLGCFLANQYTGTLTDVILSGFSSFVSALVTYVLVGVTLWYAHSTRGLLQETKHAREQDVAPAFVLDFKTTTITPQSTTFLMNVGKGPAHDFTAFIKFTADNGEETDEKKLVAGPLLRVDYGLRISELAQSIDETEITESYDYLKLKVTYRDHTAGENDTEKTTVLSYKLTEYSEEYDTPIECFNLDERNG